MGRAIVWVGGCRRAFGTREALGSNWFLQEPDSFRVRLQRCWLAPRPPSADTSGSPAPTCRWAGWQTHRSQCPCSTRQEYIHYQGPHFPGGFCAGKPTAFRILVLRNALLSHSKRTYRVLPYEPMQTILMTEYLETRGSLFWYPQKGYRSLLNMHTNTKCLLFNFIFLPH